MCLNPQLSIYNTNWLIQYFFVVWEVTRNEKYCCIDFAVTHFLVYLRGLKKNCDAGLVYYMAGYVARKCLQKSSCSICCALLLVPASEGKTDMQSGFTGFHDRHGLMYSPKKLFNFVNYSKVIAPTALAHVSSMQTVFWVCWHCFEIRKKTLGSLRRKRDCRGSLQGDLPSAFWNRI